MELRHLLRIRKLVSISQRKEGVSTGTGCSRARIQPDQNLLDHPTLRSRYSYRYARHRAKTLASTPAALVTTWSLEFHHSNKDYKFWRGTISAANGYGPHAQSFKLCTGTNVEAKNNGAISLNKNAVDERDPAMHRTRKAKQWTFSMT